ncbi:hypothetical protein NHQ30_004574 [Ciborinia camelliae]|nr:hypothetical protein NHQ30_004574 [Ciborinia camelliae]
MAYFTSEDCATENNGRMMLEGEFHGMTELYRTLPSFVPKPHAWGKFESASETYFFLCDFIQMSNDAPDPTEFCSSLAKLHKASKSPTGSFGFHVITYQGKFAQAVQWDNSWQSFFRSLLSGAMRLDMQENGIWDELDKVSKQTLSQVLPQLLGPLESEGRHVKPTLIHGDLWDGNIGTDFESGNI